MARLLALLLCAASAVALADLVAPIEDACRGKSAGAACRAELGQGTCTPATCERYDYSEGPPPKVKLVDCLKCTAPSKAVDAGARGAGAPSTAAAGVTADAGVPSTAAVAGAPDAGAPSPKRKKGAK